MGLGFAGALGLGGAGVKKVTTNLVSQARKSGLARPSPLNPQEVVDLANFRERAGTGAMMDDATYANGIAAMRKAGLDPSKNNQGAIDDLLGAHRTYDTRKSVKQELKAESKLLKEKAKEPATLQQTTDGYSDRLAPDSANEQSLVGNRTQSTSKNSLAERLIKPFKEEDGFVKLPGDEAPQVGKTDVTRKAIAQQVQKNGGQVDENGMVTLYHATTPDIANEINKTGTLKTGTGQTGGMTGKKIGDSAFLGLDKDTTTSTWGNGGLVEIKVPAEYVRQPAKNLNEVYVEGGLVRQ
jgi:hypothetical protein